MQFEDQPKEVLKLPRDSMPFWFRLAVWIPAAVCMVVVLLTLPLSTQHLEVGMFALILSVHHWWLLDSLRTGVFESKQGRTLRANQPFRFWMMCVGMAILQGTFWVVFVSKWLGEQP